MDDWQMNPYDPPTEPPKHRKPKIVIDWLDFFIVLIVVFIGTPFLHVIILDYLTEWFIYLSL
jgi:hypothetical protein